MSRCRSVEKQDLHIKSLKLATTGLHLEFFIVYNWFMADFLVLFYYWNLFGLWLALHWLLKHYFTAVLPLLLLEFWLVYDWFELTYKYCFSTVLCMVWLKSSFYFTKYTIYRGNPVILQGWVLNWSNLWFFKFRLFLSFL